VFYVVFLLLRMTELLSRVFAAVLVSCLVTSLAAMMDKTYASQTDDDGRRVCSTNQPTTVIAMQVGTLDGQCGVQCTISTLCQFYQFKAALAQCELFDHVPPNASMTDIDQCVAYASLNAGQYAIRV